MKTLTEYFKNDLYLPKGSFLLKNNVLYVLSAFFVGKITITEITSGWTETTSVHDEGHITSTDIRHFFYEPDMDEDETLSLVHILTRQEAADKFSELILSKD